MLLWMSVVLGWLVLAVGALAYASALRLPPGEEISPAGRQGTLLHRLLCWMAAGWGVTLVWLFLDMLATRVVP